MTLSICCRRQLQIPATLMLVALEVGPGPPIKFQYADLSKLYQTVALLVRCCDITAKMTSSEPVSGGGRGLVEGGCPVMSALVFCIMSAAPGMGCPLKCEGAVASPASS